MRKIAFVTQKGGSGKSTLALGAALAAREAGERVFILDMDPQRSLGHWSDVREDNDIPVEYVAPAKLARALAELEKAKISLVIIDTPSTETAASETAIKAADLCIVPVRPSAFDLWSSERICARIKAHGVEFAFVLNQCSPMQESQRVQDGVSALETQGGLLNPLVVSRADYQDAARQGLGPTELAPEGKAAHEMRLLWGSIKKRLAKTKQNQGAKDAAAKEVALKEAPAKTVAKAA